MTDDKKHDDKDRKKLSDEEMEDVAGGMNKAELTEAIATDAGKKDKKKKSGEQLTQQVDIRLETFRKT